MDERLTEATAADSFAALGHPVRLRIFRLLVRAGADGANVGQITRRLALPASTLAHHLQTLVSAGIVRQERHGREVISRADYDAMSALTRYLTEECCADAGQSGRDVAWRAARAGRPLFFCRNITRQLEIS